MRVLHDDFFVIYVYSEALNKHHMPHCHVRSPDGDIVVALPTLTVLVGGKLSKRAKNLLLENIDKICEAWNKLNPEIETTHE